MKNGIKLSTWAKSKGLGYRAAYNQLRAGTLPCPWEQLPSGSYVVYPEQTRAGKTALYARVSSRDQSEDLARQVERLRGFCSAKGWTVAVEVTEIASGLNDQRKGLLKLLSDEAVTRIIVEHKDRLARFGVATLEAALSCSGRELVVINASELKDDIVQDFVDVVTSMCARIYGKRSAKDKASRVLEAVKQ
jgi:putative resolvase